MEPEKKHSILSASSSSRWLNCTPSARAEAMESEACSVYAQEGTAAHALSELKLSYRFGKITVSDYEEKYEAFKIEYADYYNKEFEEYVDEFVEYVIQQTEGLTNYHIYFEFVVDFSHIVPQGFGTADVIIVTNDYVKVIDLKFGQGVPVSAKENSQLRLYGVGAINLFPLSRKIYMTIYQPRLLNCDTEELNKEELIDWAVNYVKPKAELAIKGEGIFCSEEETCRWCKLRGKCRVRADKQLEMAQQEFSIAVSDGPPLPQNLSAEQLSNILEIAPMFADWFKDVQAYALGQLVQGVKIPGYKLVEGKSNRIMTDENAIKTILTEKIGLTEEEVMKPREMLGISKLEALVGKKLFAEICKEYLIKPQGKLTLAPESDKRPEVSTLALAQSDFAVLVESE